jgi:hypothetical protein
MYQAVIAATISEWILGAQTSCQIWQVPPSWQGCLQRLFCAYMKKINNRVKQHRFVRRFIKQLFSGFIKRQNRNYKAGNEKIVEMLQDIQDSIEIMAREMARQAKRGE